LPIAKEMKLEASNETLRHRSRDTDCGRTFILYATGCPHSKPRSRGSMSEIAIFRRPNSFRSVRPDDCTDAVEHSAELNLIAAAQYQPVIRCAWRLGSFSRALWQRCVAANGHGADCNLRHGQTGVGNQSKMSRPWRRILINRHHRWQSCARIASRSASRCWGRKKRNS
jgi:hypothetical protein